MRYLPADQRADGRSLAATVIAPPRTTKRMQPDYVNSTDGLGDKRDDGAPRDMNRCKGSQMGTDPGTKTVTRRARPSRRDRDGLALVWVFPLPG